MKKILPRIPYIKLVFTCFILFTISVNAKAQNTLSIRGIVKNADGNILPNASILLYYKGEKDTLKTVSNDKAVFTFQRVNPKKITLSISYIGYKNFTSSYDLSKESGVKEINDIVLNPGDNMLQEITL